MPPILTQTVLVLLGITLGSLVSRQLIQHMSAYPLTIGLLALATFCMTFGSSFYLQQIHGWDQTSAFLAASPGALSQITILAAEKGADVAAIAVVQTMRVIILTAALPLVLALTGIPTAQPLTITGLIASPFELAVLLVGSIAIALLLRLAKFPASWMFGAMIASAVLHGTGLIEGGLPPWMRDMALVGIGAADRQPLFADPAVDAAQPCHRRARLVRRRHRHLGDLRRRDRDDHECAFLRHRGGLRAGRDGRHAGAGADAAHRSDLRRRAPSVALRVRHASRRRASSICSDGRRKTWTTRIAAFSTSLRAKRSNPRHGWRVTELHPLGRHEAPQRDRGHQQRDQHVVAGEREAEEAPLHLVAADHLHLVQPLAAGCRPCRNRRAGRCNRSGPARTSIRRRRGSRQARHWRARRAAGWQARHQRRPRRAARGGECDARGRAARAR